MEIYITGCGKSRISGDPVLAPERLKQLTELRQSFFAKGVTQERKEEIISELIAEFNIRGLSNRREAGEAVNELLGISSRLIHIQAIGLKEGDRVKYGEDMAKVLRIGEGGMVSIKFENPNRRSVVVFSTKLTLIEEELSCYDDTLDNPIFHLFNLIRYKTSGGHGGIRTLV